MLLPRKKHCLASMPLYSERKDPEASVPAPKVGPKAEEKEKC